MKKFMSAFCLGILLLFIYLPIMLLAVYSFTTSPQLGSIREFSLQNYVTLFTTADLRNMIIGTFALALGSALIATILGTLGAIGAFYFRKDFKACDKCNESDSCC